MVSHFTCTGSGFRFWVNRVLDKCVYASLGSRTEVIWVLANKCMYARLQSLRRFGVETAIQHAS